MTNNFETIDNNLSHEKIFNYSFVLILLYLFLEYGRPQTYIPPLRMIRPGLLVIVLMIIALVREFQLSRVINLHTKLLIILILIMSIHVPIASNNFHAFQQWRGAVILFIIYLSILTFVNSYQKMATYIDTWISINVFGALIGIQNGGRIYNAYFMSDENDFALVMNMAIPFAYFMFMGTDSKWKKILYLICIGIFVVGSVISLSRGGFIGLAAVLFYCWLKTPRKILSTLVIVFILFILILAAPGSYWDEVKSIQDENISSGTGATRWYYWTTAMKMYAANPFIGVGQGNFPWTVEDYGGTGFYGRLHGGRVAHSLYFTIISELGTAGIFLFLMMLFYFRKNVKEVISYANYILSQESDDEDYLEIAAQASKIRYIVYAVSGALMAYLVTGLFLSVLYYPHFWILCTLVIALKNIMNDILDSTDMLDEVNGS